jgi:Domain of unknown function (DUF4136)
MKRARLVAAILILWPLLACSTNRTGADFNEEVDFSPYRSFSWLPPEEWRAPDAMAQNDRVARALKNAIEDELVRRGFRLDPDKPDFMVTFLTGVRDSVGNTVWGYGYGARSQHGGWVPTSNYREGMLIIDFLDADTRGPIWRGFSEAQVGGYEDAMARLQRTVREIIDQYPPAQGAAGPNSNAGDQ